MSKRLVKKQNKMIINVISIIENIIVCLVILKELLSICDGVLKVTYSDMPVEKLIFTKENIKVQILKMVIQIGTVYNLING